MRHLVHTAKLNRNCGHRKAMLVNLACSLIEHESIQTTTIRAKELRRFVERLITMAKAGGEHKRRLAYAKLKINTPSEFAQTKKLVLNKLFDELGPRFADRPGGYTRIIHMPARRGDSAPMCLIQLLNEPVKAKAKKEEAPKAEAPKAEEAKAE